MIVALAIALTAPPQSQVQADRIEELARFQANMPFCVRMGVTVDPGHADKVKGGVGAEAASWGVSSEVAEQLYLDALRRENAKASVDLEQATRAIERDPKMSGVKVVFLAAARTCKAAAADPIYRTIVTLPPGFEPEGAATAASDELLEAGGLASWQTPQIQARGDLMMTAGTCRPKIGAARSDALRRTYGSSDDPRVRGYYSKAFDEGLADPTIIETLAGCERAIRAGIAEAGKR